MLLDQHKNAMKYPEKLGSDLYFQQSEVKVDKRKVIILGASDKSDRTSNLLLKRLQAEGDFEIYPINPALKEIAGVPVLPDLESAPKKADILTIYLNDKRSQALENEILSSGAKKAIFNPGAENPVLMAKLKSNGMEVEEACSLVLHSMDKF